MARSTMGRVSPDARSIDGVEPSSTPFDKYISASKCYRASLREIRVIRTIRDSDNSKIQIDKQPHRCYDLI